MLSPIVETIATALHRSECGGVAEWRRVPDRHKRELMARVEDVLLAAGAAGYVLTRSPELDRPTDPCLPAS